MRVILVPLAAVCFLGACTAPDSGPVPAATASPNAASQDPNRPLPSPLPEIAARVNGEAIPLHRILPLARTELMGMPEDEQDARQPEALRRALEQYIDRELLFQEAVSRKIEVDQGTVDWAYDHARSDFRDDDAWNRELAKQGMDDNSFRTEVRIRQTVSALLEQEDLEPLLARLRAEARIETFL